MPSVPAGEVLAAVAAARFDAAERFPYLSSALFAMTPVVRPNGGTTSVDGYWRLYIDPGLSRCWSHEDFVTGVLHEVWHLLRDHHGRAASHEMRHPVRWNIACDAEINDDLAAAGLQMLATDVLPCRLGFADNRLAEEYYNLIEITQSPTDCGSGVHGQARPWDLDADDTDTCAVHADEAEEIRDVVAAAAVAARSDVPFGVQRWARGKTRPTVDWRKQLGRSVRGSAAVTAGAADYSFARPSRRSVCLPGIVMPGLVRPVPVAAVIVDTSASVDDHMLGTAVSELDGILASRGHRSTPVFMCDAACAPVQRVVRSRRLQLSGGGGTDLREGFTAVGRVKPRPDVTIVITDGHTLWPSVAPRGRVVVCLLPSETPPPPPPWAHVVRVTR